MYADPTDIARDVARGAAWLDTHAPGWTAWINHDINAADRYRCPLGQRFGDFYAAPFPTFNAERFGFDATDPDEFDQLDAEWTRLITARRTVAVIPDGVDFDIECGACGARERNVATDPIEARRVADQHVCDDPS